MARKKSPSPKRDDEGYEIGYGRPPLHSRFMPGQSGNRRGRPKGMRNFKTDVAATLQALVKVTRDGRPRRISTQNAMLLRLREKALKGDSRALDRLILLAQTYNNDEPIPAGGLPADDATVLSIYRARVASGAAGESISNENAEETGGSVQPLQSTPSIKKTERYRSRTRK